MTDKELDIQILNEIIKKKGCYHTCCYTCPLIHYNCMGDNDMVGEKLIELAQKILTALTKEE